MSGLSKMMREKTKHHSPVWWAAPTTVLGLPAFAVTDQCDHVCHFTFDPESHRQACSLLARHAEILPADARRRHRLFSMVEACLAGGSFFRLNGFFLAGGTALQQKVWRAIADIPFGGTVTYGDIARMCGTPQGFRAVGNACGKNPVALFVPCHRVVASSSPGGFTGGLHIKRCLLAHEKSWLSSQ